MRSMKTEWYFRLGVMIAGVLLVSGCSDLKNEPQAASPVFVYVHPQGFKSPSSPDFHGKAIQNAGWEMRDCRQCHGGAYTGGNALSCVSAGCHVDASENPKSPESCNTCHGTFSSVASDTLSWMPPRSLDGDTASTARGVGAHQYHLISTFMDLSPPFTCATCHQVPSSVYAAGHLNASGRAQVTFVASLAKTPSGGVTPSPSYDYDAQNPKCSNTYCHGNWSVRKSASSYQFAYTDSVIVGNSYAPHWTGGESEDACGSCHGLPPTGHRDFGTDVSTCNSCHYLDPAKQGGALDKSIHVNGKIDLYGQEYSFK
jgi:predicted CxxxxCH...CXXCH cytochrome family protein